MHGALRISQKSMKKEKIFGLKIQFAKKIPNRIIIKINILISVANLSRLPNRSFLFLLQSLEKEMLHFIDADTISPIIVNFKFSSMWKEEDVK
jgi:hypothetical protein